MSGLRGSRFAVVAALALSGNALAQQPPAIPPLPDPGAQPTPPIAIPNLPPVQPKPLPVVEIPLPAPAPPAIQQAMFPPPTRFAFKIDPNTPLKDLLPAAPKVAPVRGPLLTDDLAKVPEAEFEARPEKLDGKLTAQAAHQLAKISHANAKKTDAFMAALLESRPDLAGLPFAMGDDCRTGPERSKQFALAVATVRGALPPADFWSKFNQISAAQDAARSKSDKALAEHVAVARVAALMQMLAPESAELRVGLAKYLAGVSHVEATRALAKLAIFSAEDEVRAAAVEALKVRRDKDYTDVLVKGLRYPFPAVAKRAADAIAGTSRSDLLPELVAVLEEEDPRMPREKAGKKPVVREMVKVNHHRNCMMCHAPGTGVVPASALTAEVPVQGQSLPSPAQGYGQSSPDLMIRVDVTYLRQDFSVMLAVAEAHQWPEMQRFDFMVRERTLTADEADEYRDKLTPKGAGALSPYHKAVLSALRELTGKDTAPTAAAWRKLLEAK